MMQRVSRQRAIACDMSLHLKPDSVFLACGIYACVSAADIYTYMYMHVCVCVCVCVCRYTHTHTHTHTQIRPKNRGNRGIYECMSGSDTHAHTHVRVYAVCPRVHITYATARHTQQRHTHTQQTDRQTHTHPKGACIRERYTERNKARLNKKSCASLLTMLHAALGSVPCTFLV
jgi:hypothetical protein